jgi:hypothetical protein
MAHEKRRRRLELCKTDAELADLSFFLAGLKPRPEGRGFKGAVREGMHTPP